MTRGLSHNTGVPAGTLIGVECFMAFIATCTSLTGKNKELLWVYFSVKGKATAKIELNLSPIRELKMIPSLEGWKPK